MEISYDCENCALSVRFEASDKKATGNASWEDCQCPQCGAVLGTMRADWDTPKVVGTSPLGKKTST